MHPGQDRPSPRRSRPLWLGLGYCSLALAALGVALPLLPTTPFLLLAAWAFGRASPELRQRLRANPRFGPMLRDWEEHGAISARGKRASLTGMALCWLLLLLVFRDALVAGVAGACMAAVAVYILTRPVPHRAGEAPPGGNGGS
jgi:uncharacterized protein